MKAAVYRSYGPPEVLKVEDIKQPSIQDGDDDLVLIKVHSASVNPFDYLHRQGFLPTRPSNSLLKPKQQIMGIDVAGTIEAIGKNVSKFKKEDFTQNGKKHDIILDAVGWRTYFSCKSSLTETGVYVTENPLKAKCQLTQILFSKLTGDKRLKMHLAQPNDKDMDFFRQLVENEKLKPVIEKTYPLDQIAAAQRHVKNGHTKGKFVIEIQKG